MARLEEEEFADPADTNAAEFTADVPTAPLYQAPYAVITEPERRLSQ